MKWSAIGGVLLTIGLLSTSGAQAGNEQAGHDVWVSPPHSVATGMAPGMKVKLLSANSNRKTYAVIFSKDDEAFSGLTDFARQYHVTAAHFTAIGALESARLAWFDPTRKMYKQISIDSQVEVLSMIGDIALYKGKPAVHTHMVVGLPDGSTRGGHVLEAHVRPTLEVIVTVEPNVMVRRLDPETDLSLIDPAAHE